MIDEQFFVKIFNDYSQQFPDGKLPELRAYRQQALQQFVDQELPTRHDEDWKYTPIRSLLEHEWQWGTTSVTNNQPIIEPYRFDHLSHPMLFVDGQCLQPLSSALTTEIQIMDLANALQQYPEIIQPYLLQDQTFTHAFQHLNGALMQNGLVIIVPPNVTVVEPIHVLFFNQTAKQQVHLRNIIIAGEHSQVTVIEHFVGEGTQPYFTNSLTQIECQAESKVTHIKLLQEGSQAYHIGHVTAQQAQHSQFDSFSFALRGGWIRSDTHIELAQPFAKCQLQGLYLGQYKQHIDHHTFVHHAQPNGCSNEFYKGILLDQARAVFNGRVLVAKDAQKTDAVQKNKNLLLTNQAEVDTKPQLEIYADDVKCAHGATVGQLDSQALFYLRSRGLDAEQARSLLIEAFALEIIEQVPDAALQPTLVRWLYQELARIAS